MTFVRFPSTAHLAVDEPARCVRADKVLSPEQAEDLLSDAVRVEEKVDGDNLGISVQAGELRVQHRGDYVRPDEGWRYPHRSRRGWRPMSLASSTRSGTLSSSANGARRSTPCATTPSPTGSWPLMSTIAAARASDRPIGVTPCARASA